MVMYKRPRSSALRRPYKRRRVVRRRARIGLARVSRPVNMAMRPFAFKRQQYWAFQTPNTVTTSGFWVNYYFSLQQMPDYTEVTNLFDEYKISAMRIRLVPRSTEVGTDQALAGSFPKTTVAVCYDNKSALTNYNSPPSGAYNQATFNNFLEQGRVRTANRGSIRDVVIYQPYMTMYDSSRQQWIRSHWLSTSITSQNHQCCNVFFMSPNFGTWFDSYDVYVTWYIQARNVK